ncbi:MAG: hypothetical protein LBL56_02140 [Treponema sp.]|jgi:hypothetical protein|nr:hypothetical protein [Treponema sp.]
MTTLKYTYRLLPVLVFIVLNISPVSAQSSGTSQVVAPNILPDVRPPSSSPRWVQDLRRGEIVAFGSFPFTVFLSTVTMDSFRYFNNDRNPAYLPWPLKGPGAVEMSREEKERTLFFAAAASVTIALVDFTIVAVRRHREAVREQMRNRGGEIHVTRSPIGDTETIVAGQEAGEHTGEAEEENP